MATETSSVTGVYERVPGSDIWSARIRVNRKLVRKSFGRVRKGGPMRLRGWRKRGR